MRIFSICKNVNTYPLHWVWHNYF